jgi:putative membrane protein
MDGPFFLSGWLWTLILLALVAALIYFLVRLSGPSRRDSSRWIRDRIDSIELLNVRFARGEIDQEEYIRMRHALEDAR